ncbi:hypothetical protein D6792_02775 [Candidatus Parcubacteria bacterium]|nr:MAG: hypothetical protein D6792_02775 [Candidatus Parcubacteria bacterium]
MIACRADKNCLRISSEVERWLGRLVVQAAPELSVSLRNPQNALFIEVLSSAIGLWVRESAWGGLPVGSSSDAVCILSVGFALPVASYLMMKRGVRVHWSYF